MGIGCGDDVGRVVVGRPSLPGVRSAELALPRGPHGGTASSLAGRQLVNSS